MEERYEAQFSIIRTPLYPFEELAKLNNDPNQSLNSLWEDPILRDAIFIASPVLYQELIKQLNMRKNITDKKLFISLYKYLNRCITRCTPFGLFASVAIIDLKASGKNQITIQQLPKFRMKLDMDYLHNLYRELIKKGELTKSLLYFKNNTLYKVSNKWRYVESYYKQGIRHYRLVGIDDNPVLSKIILSSENGIQYNEIITLIRELGYEINDAIEYVRELINSQVLIDELYPSLSGEEYQNILIKRLTNLLNLPLNNLTELLTSEGQITSGRQQNILERSKELRMRLSEIADIDINDSRFIQVDSSREVINGSINSNLANRVLDVIPLLHRLSDYHYKGSKLYYFTRAFHERYEDNEIPLTVALDTDFGINYETAKNELIGQDFSSDNSIKRARFQFKLGLYLKALKNNLRSIELQYTDIIKIPNEFPLTLGDSFAFCGAIINAGNESNLLWTGLTTANGLTFIGRFGHIDSRIHDACVNLTKEEENVQPDKIYAEIVHLSEDRMGNIASRPIYRKYEIPYLVKSNVESQAQILITDLMLSVKNGRLVLRSKRLNKEVLPKMSNAHNFTQLSLPIYQFLCEMQSQNRPLSLGWEWGELSNEKYLPRITYKNIILSPASFSIESDHLLKTIDETGQYHQFKQVKKDLSIPDLVFMGDGDNKLLLDLSSKICIELLLNYSKINKRVRLEEFIKDEGLPVVTDEVNKKYLHEVIIPFVKQKTDKAPSADVGKRKNVIGTRKSFSPFSEWVYYKIYTGPKIIDDLLATVIPSIAKRLLKKGYIDKWFFVRYRDPQNHLRIRLHLKEKKYIHELNSLIELKLKRLINSKIIYNIKIDTYERELDRYEDINYSENLFHKNSEAVCSVLALLQSEKLSDEHRVIFAIIGIHYMYNLYNLSLEDRSKLSEEQRIKFAKEFNVQSNKSVRERIKKNYRAISDKLENAVSENCYNLTYKKIGKIYTAQNKALVDSIKSAQKKEGKDLDSYIHMFINRLFTTDQRYEEMLIYHYVAKFYQSELAKKRFNR